MAKWQCHPAPFYAGNLDFMPQTWCIFVLFSINNLFFMSLFFLYAAILSRFPPKFSPIINCTMRVFRGLFSCLFCLEWIMHTLIHCAITACSYKVLFFVYYIIKEPFIFLACTRYQTGFYRIIYDKIAYSRGGNANSLIILRSHAQWWKASQS